MKVKPDKALIFGTILGIVAFYLILGQFQKLADIKK